MAVKKLCKSYSVKSINCSLALPQKVTHEIILMLGVSHQTRQTERGGAAVAPFSSSNQQQGSAWTPGKHMNINTHI